MIWESRYWKADLLRFADRLRRARTTARPLSTRDYVTVEKAVLMGAFVVRRLADSHKLSDATAGMQLRVTRWPSNGRGVTLANNHRLDELFDFSSPERCRQPLPFLCNQAIHSYVFASYSGRSSKGLAGVFLASDRQCNRALFAVPLAEWEPESRPRNPVPESRPRDVSPDPAVRATDLHQNCQRSTRPGSLRSVPGTLRALPCGMTAPRYIVPNATYLITRRCLGRMFLLRPSPLVNAVFEYTLAVTARRYGILLHGFCVLSNHFHCVLTDPLGRLPEFERDLGSIVARALNAAHGRWESFWAPCSYSAVALQTAEDVLDKLAYVLANPVAAGLVRRGSEWPGLWSAPARIGAGPRLVTRPDHFFRKSGTAPEAEWLELACPPGFDSVEALRARLTAALEEREDRAARDVAAAGRSFMGARAVLAQKPHARPAPGEPRRGLKPRIASRDRWKRIEAIGRLRSFLVAYREAWRAFVGGNRDAVFPEGTYWMRAVCCVPCRSSA